MSREIKFRGKDIETNEWIYGDLIQRLGRFPAILYDYECNGKVHYAECAVDRKTVGQYTGIKDKHDNEIYPGDILYSKGKIIGYVVDGVRAYCYDVKYINHTAGENRWTLWATVTVDYEGDIEIEGNIYDNPELITEDKQP